MTSASLRPLSALDVFLVRRRVAIMLVTILVASGWLLVHRYHPSSTPRSVLLQNIGIGLILGGLILRSWAAAILRKGEALASQGPYSAGRHPLYLGSTLMVVGFCVFVGDWWASAMLLAAWGVTYPATIANEEAQLAIRYPRDWPAYAACTPRLGLFRLPTSLGPVSLRTWLKNREYKAVLSCVVGVVALEVWRIHG